MVRLLATLCTFAMVLSFSVPAQARDVFGATIPDPAEPIGDEADGRFILSKRYKRALQELRRRYGNSKGIIIRRVASSRQVTAVYVQNTRPNRTWDGINLYEDLTQRRVYISVLRAGPPQPQ